MACWYVAPAFFNPKVITTYSNKPTAPGTLNAVLCMSSGGHKDLVIAHISIHEGQDLVTSSSVNQCFRDRRWVLVFWRRSVEVPEIHADPPSAILLLHRYHTRNPFCISTRPDEPSFQHLLHLLFNLLEDFGLHLSCPLLERPKSLLEREPMFDDTSI